MAVGFSAFSAVAVVFSPAAPFSLGRYFLMCSSLTRLSSLRGSKAKSSQPKVSVSSMLRSSYSPWFTKRFSNSSANLRNFLSSSPRAASPRITANSRTSLPRA